MPLPTVKYNSMRIFLRTLLCLIAAKYKTAYRIAIQITLPQNPNRKSSKFPSLRLTSFLWAADNTKLTTHVMITTNKVVIESVILFIYSGIFLQQVIASAPGPI